MAEAVSSWIAKAVVQHDRKHGANLEAVTDRVKRLVQITKFHTYRTADNPRAHITGLISDKTHNIPVVFDVEATDAFESPDSDLPPERLTANLRAIMKIKSYRWKLGPPPVQSRRPGHAGPSLELPVLSMEILDFEIHSDGPDSPVYFENVVDVGRAKEDGEVQKVLRKWYFGESNSDPSQVDKSFEISQPEAGPSRLTLSSPVQPRTTIRPLPDGIITLADFLEPYISDNGSKKGKTIPEYIFHTTEEIEAGLAAVRVFGLDFDPDEEPHQADAGPSGSAASASQQPASSPPARLDKGKQRAVEVEPPVQPTTYTQQPSATQYDTPPVPLGQRPQSTQTFAQPSHPTQDADDEDSEDEMPIRPLPPRTATQRRRPIFASSPAPQPTQDITDNNDESAAVGDDDVAESTDSEMLSDHERQTRKRRRNQDGAEGSGEPRRKTRVADPAPAPEPEPGPEQEHDSLPLSNHTESIPASATPESYSLSKQYPSPPKPAVVATAITTDVQTTTDAIVVRSQVQMDESSLDSTKSKNTNGTGGSAESYATPPPSSSPAPAPRERLHEQEQEQERENNTTTIAKSEHASPIATTARQSPVGRFVLDMSVDGLSEATAQRYVDKVCAARAKRAASAATPAPA